MPSHPLLHDGDIGSSSNMRFVGTGRLGRDCSHWEELASLCLSRAKVCRAKTDFKYQGAGVQVLTYLKIRCSRLDRRIPLAKAIINKLAA